MRLIEELTRLITALADRVEHEVALYEQAAAARREAAAAPPPSATITTDNRQGGYLGPDDQIQTVNGPVKVRDIPVRDGVIDADWLAENCACEKHAEARRTRERERENDAHAGQYL